MTTSAQTSQPSDAQVQTVATILAAGLAGTAVSAALAGALAVTPAVALAALRLARQPARALSVGPATSATLANESLYRAAYVAASARRIQANVAGGMSLSDAVSKERGFYDAHRQATQNRLNSAAKVDQTARKHGPTLGWYAVMDTKTSAECRAANGRNFSASQRPLIGWPGSVHPHCFPAGTTVSGPRAVASTARWYEGDLVEIETRSGAVLTATPNHPVLTVEGWVAAGLLVEGHEVVREVFSQRPVRGHPNDYQQPALIEDVARSLGSASSVSTARVPVTAENFHGDGLGSQVAVVRTDSLLRDDWYAASMQPSRELALAGTAIRGATFTAFSQTTQVLDSVPSATASHVCSLGEGSALLGSATSLFEPVGINDAAPLNLRLIEPPIHGDARDAVVSSEAFDRPSVAVTACDEIVGWVDPIVRRSVSRSACHVYNLQTTTGWYVANGIVVHNCRCKPGLAHAGAGTVDQATRGITRPTVVGTREEAA